MIYYVAIEAQTANKHAPPKQTVKEKKKNTHTHTHTNMVLPVFSK